MKNFKQIAQALTLAASIVGGVFAGPTAKEAEGKGVDCADLAHEAAWTIFKDAVDYKGKDGNGLFGLKVLDGKLSTDAAAEPATFSSLFGLSDKNEDLFRTSQSQGLVVCDHKKAGKFRNKISRTTLAKALKQWKTKTSHSDKHLVPIFEKCFDKKVWALPWVEHFHSQSLCSSEAVKSFHDFSPEDTTQLTLRGRFAHGFATELGKLTHEAKEDNPELAKSIELFTIRLVRQKGFIDGDLQAIEPKPVYPDLLDDEDGEQDSGNVEHKLTFTSWRTRSALGVASVVSLLGGFYDTFFKFKKDEKLTDEELEQDKKDRNLRRITGATLSVVFAGLLLGSLFRKAK